MKRVLNIGIAWKLITGGIYLTLKKPISFASLLLVENQDKKSISIDDVTRAIQKDLPDFIVHANVEDEND
jgi:hypothetical protein